MGETLDYITLWTWGHQLRSEHLQTGRFPNMAQTAIFGHLFMHPQFSETNVWKQFLQLFSWWFYNLISVHSQKKNVTFWKNCEENWGRNLIWLSVLVVCPVLCVVWQWFIHTLVYPRGGMCHPNGVITLWGNFSREEKNSSISSLQLCVQMYVAIRWSSKLWETADISCLSPP